MNSEDLNDYTSCPQSPPCGDGCICKDENQILSSIEQASMSFAKVSTLMNFGVMLSEHGNNLSMYGRMLEETFAVGE